VSLLRTRDLRTLHLGPFSFEVAAGACLALSGPSGSGKTLLLRALADLDPHAGAVELDGTAQADCSGPEWRRRVGFLPAESHWWAPRVGDHFRSPADALRSELEHFGLDPACFDWEVERLSSGERQRLALLRLLDIGPQALLLDEPTANLDTDSGAAVEARIAEYRKERGAAVVWVSHDAAQRARVADDELILENGS
jgi:ABC-type iron transport system FetAB ATPase subunit